MSFLQLISLSQQKQQPKPVRRREIFDLAIIRANRCYYYGGDNLKVEQLSAGAVVAIRFSDPDASLRVLGAAVSYPLLPFNRIYVTNAAQVGLTLTVSFDFYGFGAEDQASEALQAITQLADDIKLDGLRLLDSGTIVRAGAINVNITTILYTVPAGQNFYFFHYDLDCERFAAGAMSGILDTWDGFLAFGIAELNAPAGTVDNMHTSGSFSFVRIPAGWDIRLFANANSSVTGNILGVVV